jgi:hypothetical protein
MKVDLLYAALMAAGIISTKTEFSRLADLRDKAYRGNGVPFPSEGVVRIARKLNEAGHVELAALATEIVSNDLQSTLKSGGEQ